MSASAIYNRSVPSYCRGNPLIEALPLPPEGDALVAALYRKPLWDGTGAVSNYFRFAQASALLDFNLPRPESALLVARLWSMLVNSYQRRHPFYAETIRRLGLISEQALRGAAVSSPPSDSIAVIGWSGMGKTTLIRSVLGLFPQVIVHRAYEGQPFVQKQVLWLSVDAPINGSPKGLLLALATALDRALGLSGPGSYQYELNSGSTEVHKVVIARALAAHYVGLIHIDDLQRIGSRSSSQRETAASTIISLANVVGASLVFSGTPDAEAIVTTNFEVSRRVSRRGIIGLASLPELGGEYFEALVTNLFAYQLQPGPACVADDDVKQLMANLAAGIPAVLVSLYVAAQESAILDSHPLTPNLFAQVRKEQFRVLIPALSKLNRARIRGRAGWTSEDDELLSQTLREWRKERKEHHDLAESTAA